MSVESTHPAIRRDKARRSRAPLRRLRCWWATVTEPRHLSIIYGGIYTAGAVTGVITLIAPPSTIAGELGPVLLVTWALLFLVGGIVGMSTVLQGFWKWERWANYLTLGGIAIYGGVITTLHIESSGSRLTQLGVLGLAAGVFIVRLALIRGRSYGPHV